MEGQNLVVDIYFLVPFPDVMAVFANGLLVPEDPRRIPNNHKTVYTSPQFWCTEDKFLSWNEMESVIIALIDCMTTVCPVLYMHLARDRGVFWSGPCSSRLSS